MVVGQQSGQQEIGGTGDIETFEAWLTAGVCAPLQGSEGARVASRGLGAGKKRAVPFTGRLPRSRLFQCSVKFGSLVPGAFRRANE